MLLPTRPGNRLNYVNGGTAVLSGAVVVINSGATGLIGIALANIAANATGTVLIGPANGEGIVEGLAKHTGEAFTQGQYIYWDATNLRLTGTSTGNTRAGRAADAAASAATTANLILNR